jgi:hypothetical protein
VGHQDKTQDQTRQTSTQAGETGHDQTWKQDRPQDWDRDTTGMTQGHKTDPAQPDGTKPLERDQQPMDQNR